MKPLEGLGDVVGAVTVDGAGIRDSALVVVVCMVAAVEEEDNEGSDCLNLLEVQ